MAVYHFTLHAYRSWRPDHPRGYVHHTNGLLPPDPVAAKWYDAHAKSEPTIFDEKVQRLLYRGTSEICRNRNWRFHGGASDPTHFHVLVSWIEFVSCQDVLARMKNLLSYILGQEIRPRGRKWFVRGGSKRRVKDRGHFDYLLDKYFPDHRGLVWREGEPLP